MDGEHFRWLFQICNYFNISANKASVTNNFQINKYARWRALSVPDPTNLKRLHQFVATTVIELYAKTNFVPQLSLLKYFDQYNS